MLHPAVVAELLEQEAAVAREAHGRRFASLKVIGTDVICHINGTNQGDVVVRLDGSRDDAEPLGVSILNPDGTIAPLDKWPGSVYHSDHPTLRRSWSCTRGCFEYHQFPGHSNESWDVYRHDIRLVSLLNHLLRKAGK